MFTSNPNNAYKITITSMYKIFSLSLAGVEVMNTPASLQACNTTLQEEPYKMSVTYVCQSCNVFVDVAKHVKCLACGVKFTVQPPKPYKPSNLTDTPETDVCPACNEYPGSCASCGDASPVRDDQPPFGWMADGTQVDNLPGRGHVYRVLSRNDWCPLLWECDGTTGDPIRYVFISHCTPELWRAYCRSGL